MDTSRPHHADLDFDDDHLAKSGPAARFHQLQGHVVSQADQRCCWDYSFTWSAHHLTPEQLHPLKFSYDKVADNCLASLQSSPPSSSSSSTSQAKPTQCCAIDYYTLLCETHHTDAALTRFWTDVHSVPSWVNWPQIARGQEVFHRYSLPLTRALNSLSLTGGMSASRIVETLYRTGGFSPHVARRRILETTHFVSSITESLDSIMPRGRGHRDAIKVRLLHASVRRRILELEGKRHGYFDVDAYGVPGCDLDSIATIGSFSAALIWRGLPRQGVYMRAREIEDYLALWRLVAHYLGTPTEYFRTPEIARATLESIIVTETKPSERSALMAKNIITCLADTPPMYVSLELSNVTVRWMLGKELADGLRIGHQSRKQWKESLLNKSYGLGKDAEFMFEHVPDYHTATTFEGRLPGKESCKWVSRCRTELVGVMGLLIAATALWAGLMAVYWALSLLRVCF
ncbi:hypothetical protein KEM56_004526 [Ascosphaera pollenicola]|nr:hypothetical protein KEM56_004526 [Ascosphaera pollenicola]